MRVIPSRADGEGPHSCNVDLLARAQRIAHGRRSTLQGGKQIDIATVRSLAVCAARDDTRERERITNFFARTPTSAFLVGTNAAEPSESLGSQKRRRIDQLARLDSRRDAKEQIHRSQPAAGAESRHSIGRNTEIRQQPVCVVGRRTRASFFTMAASCASAKQSRTKWVTTRS